MSGYTLVQKIRRLEQELDQLGLVMTGASHYYRDFGDVVAVRPKDSVSLPIYSRDAELFIGTIDALDNWIQGVEWARKYDSLLFGRKHNSTRERREQNYRNERLIECLKTTEQPMEKS